MRKNMPHKPTHDKRPAPGAKKLENVGKEIASRLLASLRGALGSDTLEGMHRASWRHYLTAVLLAFVFSLPCGKSYSEVDATVTQTISKSSSLTSREGGIKKIAADNKKAVPARALTAKQLKEEEEKKKE